MKRRQLLGGAAAGSAVIAGIPAPAISQGRRQLRMVTSWPKGFPGLGVGAQRLADRIGQVTGGRLSVEVFGAGELVPAFDAFDAVADGTADLYHAVEQYWAPKTEAFHFFATVPLGLTANEMNAWIHFGGGQQLWDELSADYNVKAFLCGNTGVQMAGWFNRELNTLGDFQGLRMRIPGLGGKVISKIGGVPVNMPGGKILDALQSREIDATEWIGPFNDLAFGFHKYAAYYYYPGVHEPGTSQSLGINLGLWNSLQAEDRALIAAVANDENNRLFSEFSARNGEALQTLISEHSVEIRRMDPAVFRALALASRDVVAEVGSESSLTKRIYDSYSGFQKTVSLWTELSDQAFVEARARYL